MAQQKTQDQIAIEKRAADEKAKILAKLAEIVDAGPDGITKPDKIYLKARQSYLTHSQREVMADILEPKKPAPKDDKKDK